MLNDTSKVQLPEEETQDHPKIEFPNENVAPAFGRGPQGTYEMQERARQIDPALDTPRAALDFQEGTDTMPNREIALRRNQRLAEARAGAIDDLISNSETADAALFMPTTKDPVIDAIHREYGETLGATLVTSTRSGQDLPEEAQLEVAEIMGRMATTQSKMRDMTMRLMEEKEKNETVFHKGWQFALSLIPLSDRAAILTTELPQGSILAGNSFKEGIDYVYNSEDPVATAERVVRDLDQINPNTAQDFLMALNSHSSWDLFSKNIFDGLDIGTAGVTIKAAKLIAGAGKSLAKNGPSVSKMAEELGDNTTAAVADLAQDVRDQAKQRGAAFAGEGAEQATDTNVFLPRQDPDRLIGSPLENLENETFPDSSRHGASRFLNEKFHDPATIEKASEMISNSGISNVAPEDLAYLLQSTADDFIMNDIKAPTSAILNFGVKKGGEIFEFAGHPQDRLIRGENFADNVDRLGFSLGNKVGNLFPTAEAADKWAQNYVRISDYQIRPKGSEGYFIFVTKPVNVDNLLDHSEQSVRITKEKGWSWLRNIVSDSFTGSKERVQDARVVADDAAWRQVTMGGFLEDAQKLKKGEMQEMTDVIDVMRDFKHPISKKPVWPTQQQYAEEFVRVHGKSASDAQLRGYEAVRQSHDLAYAIRETVGNAQQHKAGIRHWELFGDKVGLQGKRIGKDDFTRSFDEDAIIGVFNANGKMEKRYSSFNKVIGEGGYDDILKKMDEGYELIRAADGTADIGGKRVTHVLVPKSASKHRDIRFGESLAYRGGPPKIVEGRYFIKSADLKDGVMGRDRTWFSVDDIKAGEDLIQRLNEAGRLFRAGDKAAFDRYVRESIPEMDGGMKYKMDWSSDFAGVKAGSRLADNSEYMQNLKRNNPGTVISDYERFAPNRNVSQRFAGERDEVPLSTARYNQDGGVELVPATLMNPYDAVLTSLRHAFDERVYAEYIDKHTSLWFRNYGRWLHEDTVREFRSNPFSAMQNARWTNDVPGWVPQQSARLTRVTNNLLQMPVPSAQRWNRYKQYISDELNKAFPGWNRTKYGKMVDERLLHTVSDPTTFWRGITFHSKLGFFNPKQLILQGFMIGNVAVLEGVPRMQSALRAYYTSTGLSFTSNPKIIQDAAERLAKDPTTSWAKPEHFIESHKAMKGWNEVASNTALYEGQAGPKARGRIGNKVAKAADAGLYTFKKGEQTARVTAWHAAYLGWRKRVGNDAVFDAAAQREVRARASDLTVNMTRDMNAAYQRGLPALGTQFWSFQMRTMEQMLFGGGAGTLTIPDRMKLFAYYSTTFGLPVGVSSGIPWEFHETAREMALEYGIDDENHPIVETLRDGLLSATMSMMTGEDYDFTNLAPGGLPVFKDLYELFAGERNNKEMYEFLGGAAASSATQVVTGVAKAYEVLSNSFTTLSGDPRFTPTVAELLAPFEAISSVNYAKKFYMAVRLGEYITRYEKSTGIKYSGADAIMEALTGAQTDEKMQEYAKRAVVSDWTQQSREQREEAKRLFEMAFQAMRAGDMAEFENLHKRATLTGEMDGMTPMEILKLAKSIRLSKDPKEKTQETYDRLWLERIADEQRRQRAQERN